MYITFTSTHTYTLSTYIVVGKKISERRISILRERTSFLLPLYIEVGERISERGFNFGEAYITFTSNILENAATPTLSA